MTQAPTNIGIMLDLETLSLAENAVITQVALVVYDADDPETILREIEEYLPIQPQLTVLKRAIDANTIIWWMSQPDEARLRFNQNKGDDFDELSALINSICRKLEQVMEGAKTIELWARGPQFDVVNLATLMRDLGQPIPWKYDVVRDLRTIMKEAGLASEDVPMRSGLVAHHALSDCKYQIDCLVEARRRLRATR
jgi:hypothetical protein